MIFGFVSWVVFLALHLGIGVNEVEPLLPKKRKFHCIAPELERWIAYPKGGAKAGTDLNRDILWKTVAQHHFSGVTLISLNEVWSTMRFRPSEKVGQ